MYITSLKQTDLPISLVLAIENYTPQDSEGSPDKILYARETLINFKLYLLDMLNNDESIDIKQVVEDISIK